MSFEDEEQNVSDIKEFSVHIIKCCKRFCSNLESTTCQKGNFMMSDFNRSIFVSGDRVL